MERRDTVAPTIDRVSPSPSASNVAVNIGIKIYFSEAVDAGSVTSSSVWLEDSVGAPVAAQNLVSGNLVTLIPRSDLQFSATYKVNVAATIRDIVGLSLSTPFSWQFETSAAPDTTAPGVVSTFPVDGAECVDTDSSLSVTFDEAMDATTIDGHSFILKEDLGSALSGTISYVDPTATKTFSQGFKLSTSYTARVTSEASDLAGNGLASDYEWHFTTATEQGSWRNISTLDQPEWRSAHTAVWTGSEMIVWGGAQNVKRLDSGGRYDPVTDSWQPTSVVGAPSSRYGHKAVWTGNEMIVWGNGVVAAIPDLTGDGGRYDPVTDSWTAVSRDEAPLNRKNFSMTWTGNEVIVWGGLDWAGRKLGNGGRYDPLTDSWTTMSTIGAPLARYDHTAVWTGNELIIWGGFGTSGELGDGARYDPATDTWMPISMLDAPGARRDHTAIWTGTEMIVWGGNRGTDNLAAGGRYSPTDDRWQPVASQCEPQARSGHLAVWTGDRMLVWGNWNENSGGLYDPVSNSWLATPFFGARSKFGSRTAVWTGEEMIIWCGCNYPDGRYDP